MATTRLQEDISARIALRRLHRAAPTVNFSKTTGSPGIIGDDSVYIYRDTLFTNTTATASPYEIRVRTTLKVPFFKTTHYATISGAKVSEIHDALRNSSDVPANLNDASYNSSFSRAATTTRSILRRFFEHFNAHPASYSVEAAESKV